MARVEIEAVNADVQATFARVATGLRGWDDPHPPPDRVVADEEYERLTDPAKWRIVNARADAWIEVLVSAGTAMLQREPSLAWTHGRSSPAFRVDLLVPTVGGGLELVISRSRIGDVADAGVVLGVRCDPGQPAAEIALVPDCGCDACDSGSQDALDQLDEQVEAVVTGRLRLLVRGRQEIRAIDGVIRGTRNIDRRRATERVLADPRGWHVYEGRSWLAGAPAAGQQ